MPMGVVIYDVNGNPTGVSGTPTVVDTELPTATTLGDAMANSVSPLIGAVNLAMNGFTYERIRTPKVFKALSAVAMATEATIWTPTTGKKFRLIGGTISSTVAGDVTLRDGTAGTIILVVTLTGTGSVTLSPAMGNGILSAAANNLLTATGPAASALSGFVFGTEE